MNMNELQEIFSIRNNCIISYTDYSTIPRKPKKQSAYTPTKNTNNNYSASIQKRLKDAISKMLYYTNNGKPHSFITLTYSGKHTKKDTNQKHIKEFLEALQRRYKGINYVWKLEYQKNGNTHYHIIADEETNWKIIRKTWNKIQKQEVLQYQQKQKTKYKNGYYFDTEYKDKDGNTVPSEIQEKRYKYGIRTNWMNPNSTDVAIEKDTKKIGDYIGKYVQKEVGEETEETTTKKIKYWGKSQIIEQLKYPTIEENQLDKITLEELQKNTIKTITKENKYVCTIIQKVNTPLINDLVTHYKTKYSELLNKNKTQNTTLINRDLKTYTMVFD